MYNIPSTRDNQINQWDERFLKMWEAMVKSVRLSEQSSTSLFKGHVGTEGGEAGQSPPFSSHEEEG